MRLATFNLQHGLTARGTPGGADRRPDPRRLAAAVAELDPDVLALQEVDRHQRRSGGVDLTAVAAEAMGAVARRYAPTLLGTPGGLWLPAPPAGPTDGPAVPSYGIALLSRYPVLGWEQVRLPWIGTGLPLPLPGAGRGVTLRDEPRTALVARLDTPDGPRTVAATHLSFLPGWGRHQLAFLRDRLAAVPGPLALLGDLNLFGARPRQITGYAALAGHRTFPRHSPRIQLDHILARESWGAVVASRAVALPVSDHLALSVDLARPGRE